MIRLKCSQCGKFVKFDVEGKDSYGTSGNEEQVSCSTSSSVLEPNEMMFDGSPSQDIFGLSVQKITTFLSTYGDFSFSKSPSHDDLGGSADPTLKSITAVHLASPSHEQRSREKINDLSSKFPVSPTETIHSVDRLKPRFIDVLDASCLTKIIHYLKSIRTNQHFYTTSKPWRNEHADVAENWSLKTGGDKTRTQHQMMSVPTAAQCTPPCLDVRLAEEPSAVSSIDQVFPDREWDPWTFPRDNLFICLECLDEFSNHLEEAVNLCRKDLLICESFLENFLTGSSCYPMLDHEKKTLVVSLKPESHKTQYHFNSTPSMQHIASRKKKKSYPTRRLPRRQLFPKPSRSPNSRGKRNVLQEQEDCWKKNNLLASLEATTFFHNALICSFQKYNVMKDAFDIGTDGPYGVINGLRLGKLPDDSVTWDEINAAWGQTAFFLDSLIQLVVSFYNRSRQLGLKPNDMRDIPEDSTKRLIKSKVELHQLKYLNTYRIVPRGSQSIIVKRSDSSVLELYGSTGGLMYFFATRRFDTAMVIVLEISKEILSLILSIHTYLAPKSKSLSPPFQMSSDSVGKASIHLPSYAGSLIWSQCLKYLLLNFKWFVLVTQKFQSVWAS